MIELRGISKKYGDNIVLKSIDTIIPSGCVYGLVGKNGAGKTTLLNIISGVSNSSDGQCLIDGQIVKKGLSLQGVSYLPDLPSFFDYLTIEEYIKFIFNNQTEKLKRYEDYIERFSLNKKAVIKTLSRGNRQKVGLLIATITTPNVLLLDEPTSALDPVGRKEVLSIIHELKKCGTTIIFSTHILSDMEVVCDKIGFLYNGEIKREVDLTAFQIGNTAFEVVFNRSISFEILANSFSDYRVEHKDDDVIIVHDIEQYSLLNIINTHNFEIKSLRITSGIDLENTMMEVLSE